ncbi:MAG TPA: hypothetical protein VFX76_22355, partial [Roseiflexaceae bacterium]|nr:hypothetical protein [Roseiflexaceae bacterium]
MSDANVISASKKAAKAPTSTKKQSELRRVLRMLNRFLIGNRKNFVIAMFMLALESGFDLLSAYPLPWLVAYLTTNQAPPDLARIGLAWPFATLTSALIFVSAAII